MNHSFSVPHWGLWVMFLSGLVGLLLLARELGLDGWF